MSAAVGVGGCRQQEHKVHNTPSTPPTIQFSNPPCRPRPSSRRAPFPAGKQREVRAAGAGQRQGVGQLVQVGSRVRVGRSRSTTAGLARHLCHSHAPALLHRHPTGRATKGWHCGWLRPAVPHSNAAWRRTLSDSSFHASPVALPTSPRLRPGCDSLSCGRGGGEGSGSCTGDERAVE